jgi:hypothetical protein
MSSYSVQQNYSAQTFQKDLGYTICNIFGKNSQMQAKKNCFQQITEAVNICKSERSNEVTGTKREGKIILLLQVHKISKI